MAFSASAQTAQVDFFEVTAPADAVVVIHSWWLGQITEVADAAEEQLLVLTKSGATTTGTGGTTPTPVPLHFGDAAFGGVVDYANTTKATSGTIVTHEAHAWNVRTPLLQIYTPETRPVLSPSRRWTLELATTPADSITFNGTIIFEEVGG